MSGAQWREHAVVSQTVAHVPLLGQKMMETVSGTQRGLEELFAERLATLTQRGQSQTCQLFRMKMSDTLSGMAARLRRALG